ncbi:hypothetical protein ACFOU2_17725 [Bacillus songklensis]|uniref:Uncharacterized protein n=1 Tax=Bacillus songklensis TaxID=1069116 RepID=A0ABV8B771_9BACI
MMLYEGEDERISMLPPAHWGEKREDYKFKANCHFVPVAHMMKKGQVHQQQVKSVQNKVKFIHELFGLAF